MERMVNYLPYMSNVPYRTSLGEVALEIFLGEQSFFARPPAPVPLNGTQFLAASRNARLTERVLDHATPRLASSIEGETDAHLGHDDDVAGLLPLLVACRQAPRGTDGRRQAVVASHESLSALYRALLVSLGQPDLLRARRGCRWQGRDPGMSSSFARRQPMPALTRASCPCIGRGAPTRGAPPNRVGACPTLLPGSASILCHSAPTS